MWKSEVSSLVVDFFHYIDLPGLRLKTDLRTSAKKLQFLNFHLTAALSKLPFKISRRFQSAYLQDLCTHAKSQNAINGHAHNSTNIIHC